MNRKPACLLLVLAAVLPLHGQTVDGSISQALLAGFPEIAKGYVDLNGNGKMDQSDETDEQIPPSSLKDSLLRSKEVLEFLINNAKLIPAQKLGGVVTALQNPRGAIDELISLQYLPRMQEAQRMRAELEASGFYYSPSALREAAAKMEGLIAHLVLAYKKEGKTAEAEFVQARDELFQMISAGFPLPEGIAAEDADLMAAMMINAILREKDKSAPQVKLAVKTLGRLKTPQATGYLADLLKSPALRRDTVQALGDIGDKAALALLLPELDAEADKAVKAEIVKAIGKVGEKDAVPRLAALLKQPEEGGTEVTYAALGALARIAEKGTADQALGDVFRQNLASTDPQVRMLSARGLSSIKNPQTGDRLIELLKKDPLDEVRIEAIAALRKLSNANLPQALIAILKDPAASDVLKKAAIEAVGGMVGAEPAIGSVVDFLGSPNADLRAASSDALVAFHATAAQPVIAGLSRITAKGTDETALTAAASVLARLGDEASLPYLMPLFASSFPEVKKNATWALFRIRPAGNAKAVEEMKRLVKSETEALGVRINAARALGAMGNDSAQMKVADTLLTVLKMRGDKYAGLRLAALKALIDLGKPGADMTDTLLRIAERETDLEMVRESVRALQKLSVSDKEAEAGLQRAFKKQKDVETRVRIVEALADMRSAAVTDLASEITRSDTDLSVRRRLIAALASVGGEAELGAILEAARDAALKEYVQGVLEDAEHRALASLVRKREKTETSKELLEVLEGLSATMADK